MSSKRAHTKSRNGCQQCKRRRIKCDENPPCCKNCATRGLECEYLHLQGAIDALDLFVPGVPCQQPTGPQSIPPAASQAHRDVLWPAPSLDTTDLALFHHYLLRTYPTIWPEGRDHTAWQDDVPRLALSHPFLLHAILALAAAHQTSEQSNAAADSERLARQHFDTALRLFRESPEELRMSDEAAAFRSFTVIVSVVFLFLECARPGERGAVDGFSYLLTLLHNSSAILAHAKDRDGAPSPGMDVFPSGSPRRSPVPLSPGLQHSLERLQSELSLYASDQPDASELRRAYSSLLTHHFFVPSRPNDGNGFLMWPLSLDARFVDLLNRRDPAALCLLAHWCVPLCNAPRKWYTEDWARRLLLEIKSELTSTTWDEHLRWQLAETGLEA